MYFAMGMIFDFINPIGEVAERVLIGNIED